MKLLIDYLDESAGYLGRKRAELRKLEAQYRKIYDADIIREMKVIRKDISVRNSEIKTELLMNLEEFRALQRYFPELLSAFMEDENIGKVLQGKSWLLDFKSMPPKLAAAKLQQLKLWRSQLRAAKAYLRGWVGPIKVKPFVMSYPILRAQLKGDALDKKDIISEIDLLDSGFRKEGWLVLLSDSLIKIPLAKFMNKVTMMRYEELKSKAECLHMRGRGTVAEARALRALQEVARKREHYENVVRQILLANPEYLISLKNRKGWLSKEKPDAVEKFARTVVPHTLKERVWLNEMRERISQKG